jgi:serine/threonine-protein kinase
MSEEENLPPPVTGLVAGKYALVRLIGRGGMGSVWEGTHASLGTRVAIKFIEAEYANSNEARARFDTEARAAARIQSKHAIQIFDHGITENGRPYIVMEMLLGEPLDRRVERLGRMSLQETARVLQQVCRALQRAHDAGIVHRDLKPENIFLVRSHDDDDEIAKVLDFGIAKIQPPPGQQGVSSSTKTGAVLGTPYYMSPEQARGLRNVDHRTDLWSLGVIAYKCTVGVLPFEGESVGDLLVKICTAPLPHPSHAVPGLPTTFDAWFMRALDREPDRRFQSAAELSDGLLFAAGLSVRRGPTSSQPMAMGHASPHSMPVHSVPHAMPTPTPRGQSQPPPTAHSPAATPGYAHASPGLTGAPFVTSQPRAPKSSRGLIVASIIAAMVGVAAGSVAIVKLTSRSDSSNASPAPTASIAASAPTSSAPAPPASAAASTTPSTTASPPTVAVTALPTAAPGRGTARPPVTAATAPAAPTTAKTAAKPPTPPTPPTTKPNADPGY